MAVKRGQNVNRARNLMMYWYTGYHARPSHGTDPAKYQAKVCFFPFEKWAMAAGMREAARDLRSFANRMVGRAA